MQKYLKMESFGLKGFSVHDIPPYMHWLHIHLPYSAMLFGGLDKLSGEMLEAQNDQIKQTHLRRTHHKDPKMTLRMEKRRELQEMQFEIDEMQRRKPKKRRIGNKVDSMIRMLSRGLKTKLNSKLNILCYKLNVYAFNCSKMLLVNLNGNF
jgi:hypothetical protein